MDMGWVESGSCAPRVPTKDTIAGTQPVPWGNQHTKPAATAIRPHCRGGFLPATAQGRHWGNGTGTGTLHPWDGHHLPAPPRAQNNRVWWSRLPKQVQARIPRDAEGTLAVTPLWGQWHNWLPVRNDFWGQQAENPGTVAPTQLPQRERARGSGSASPGSETPSQ